MAMKFKDNAGDNKIFAIDYDGCITKDNKFPECGEPRKYAKEVINLLHDLGTKIIIWTCRDISQPTRDHIVYNDIIPMVRWMDKYGIKYDAINTSIQFAPWHYEARKVYAHMYVDDCGFGWEDTEEIMLDVMIEFMIKHLGITPMVAHMVKTKMINNEEVTAKWVRAHCI